MPQFFSNLRRNLELMLSQDARIQRVIDQLDCITNYPPVLEPDQIGAYNRLTEELMSNLLTLKVYRRLHEENPRLISDFLISVICDTRLFSYNRIGALETLYEVLGGELPEGRLQHDDLFKTFFEYKVFITEYSGVWRHHTRDLPTDFSFFLLANNFDKEIILLALEQVRRASGVLLRKEGEVPKSKRSNINIYALLSFWEDLFKLVSYENLVLYNVEIAGMLNACIPQINGLVLYKDRNPSALDLTSIWKRLMKTFNSRCVDSLEINNALHDLWCIICRSRLTQLDPDGEA